MMKIKTLVAAAAFAVTGSAFAAVGNPVATLEGGEMLLSLFSKTAETSYQLDTGILFKDFNASSFAKLPDSTTPYTYSTILDTATDTAFASFIAATGSNFSFSLLGGDNSGVPAAARSLTSTVKAGGDVTTIKNGNIVDGNNQLFTYFGAVNQKSAPAQLMSENSSTFFTKAEGVGYYYTNGIDALNTKFAIGNDNVVGTTADVYHFVRSTTAPLSDATETMLGTLDVKMLSETQYEVTFSTPPSAVPEPTSMALALVGLGALGMMARRRRAQ